MSQVIINDIPPYTQAQVPMGGQSVFGTNWTANVESDVVVYLTPVGDLPDDATQKLQYPSDFSVAFVGALQEVQVTLVTPANEGDIVTITRQTPADRENLYSNTNFLPSMLNNDFGILTLVDQQAQLVNQLIAPRYNYSAQINPAPFLTRDTILPLLGPNETWAMNASHTAIEAVAFSSGSGTITEIDTGLGLTGGPITSFGTISFAPMTANSFWGNITNGTALPTMVTTAYFLQSAKNLSDLTNVTQAQTNLNLLIGVNVQAFSSILTSLAALPGTAHTIPYFSGAGVFGSIGPAASSVLVTNASSVPSLSNTLPNPVQTNITALGAQAQDLDMGTHQIHNLVDPSAPQDAATRAYVIAQGGAFLPKAGGTMSGAIDMGNNQINNMADPTASKDAVNLEYLNTALGNYLNKSGGTMTGNINMGSNSITNLLDPVNPQDAATKNYVDTVATGLTVQPACYATTTANLNALYVNGASGIGATLTNNGALAQFTTDGTTPPTNARILVKDQTTTFQNGIYVLTNQGSGSVAWILTRSTDYDQPAEIQPGDLVIINNGTTYAGTSFVETASVSVIGTDPILFSQFTFSATAVLLKANNLNDVANKTTSFNNISPLTTKGDIIGYNGTDNVRLAVGLTNGQILQVSSGASTGLAWSTATYPATTTQNQILYSSATNVVGGISTTVGGVLVTDASSVPQFLTNPGATGRILQSVNGAIAAWSVPTYPSTSGSSGHIIISDGTNNVYSTPSYPNTATAGHVLFGDGTNIVLSTPTYPNASATARKIIVSDGTNFVASTETYATPGTSGNIMTSDGTNWTSAPNAGVTLLTTKGDLFGFSTVNARIPVASGNGKILQVDSTASVGLSYSTATYPQSTTANQILYSSATNVIGEITTAASSYLKTNGSSVPSFAALTGLIGSVNVQVFTATGANTYTPTSGCVAAWVELWAGGGGGGASTSATVSGASGGGGSYAAALVLNPTSVTISIGTGGNGQVKNNGTAGTDGGDTTYNSTTIVAKGGKHSSNNTPGVATSGETGTKVIHGAAGSPNFVAGMFMACGQSPGMPLYNPGQSGGTPPANTGSGGVAGFSTTDAGPGSSGYAVVTEFIHP